MHFHSDNFYLMPVCYTEAHKHFDSFDGQQKVAKLQKWGAMAYLYAKPKNQEFQDYLPRSHALSQLLTLGTFFS